MKNTKPMVSIICTAYNHEKYIRQCLDGFVMQKTKYKFEVLINDDASTDDTAKIIKEYQIKYPSIIKAVYQTENQYSIGVSVLMNYLKPLAKGKYIALCEGDDYWCDMTKIEQQANFLETHMEYSGCVHRTRVIDDEGNFLKYYWQSNEDSDITILDKELSFPHTSSFFFRNPWIEKSEEFKFLADYLSSWDKNFVIYMIKRGKVRYINKTMSSYRYNNLYGTSYQARMAKQNLTKEMVRAELSYYRQIQAYKINVDISATYFKMVCNYSIKKFLKSPNRENFALMNYGFKMSPYKKRAYILYAIKRSLRKCYLRLPFLMKIWRYFKKKVLHNDR